MTKLTGDIFIFAASTFKLFYSQTECSFGGNSAMLRGNVPTSSNSLLQLVTLK